MQGLASLNLWTSDGKTDTFISVPHAAINALTYEKNQNCWKSLIEMRPANKNGIAPGRRPQMSWLPSLNAPIGREEEGQGHKVTDQFCAPLTFPWVTWELKESVPCLAREKSVCVPGMVYLRKCLQDKLTCHVCVTCVLQLTCLLMEHRALSLRLSWCPVDHRSIKISSDCITWYQFCKNQVFQLAAKTWWRLPAQTIYS